MCIECHSPRDQNGNIIPGREFTGASIPVTEAGWATRAPRNRGLLGYDDRQAMRLLTEGAIAKDGAQLMPPMPRFRMTAEDAGDVIAYLRSLH
jgi:mono/diheme cytochrome c family protein